MRLRKRCIILDGIKNSVGTIPPILVCSNCVSCENKKSYLEQEMQKFFNKYFEINEMLDRKTKKTNRI